MKVIRPIAVTDAILTASSVAEADYPEWSAGTTYVQGARVIRSSVHRVYESAADGNAGNDPTAGTGQWIDVGPTNRWAMFATGVGPRTVDEDAIEITIAPPTAIDALGLVDVAADSVRVRVSDGVTDQYDRTVAVAGATVATFIDLPAFAGQTVMVTASLDGGEVAIGKLVCGTAIDLGDTATGPTIAINDYSRRETDDFGVTTVVERSWAKRISARSRIESAVVDQVQRALADLRAQATLWIGEDGFDALTAYGSFKDFSIDLQIGTASFCTLTIEGLPSVAGELLTDDPAADGASDLFVLRPMAIDDAMLVASSVAEADHPQWDAGTTYAKTALVIRQHRIWESLVDDNVGADPTADSAKWLDIGPTNRWAMFDQALGTLTTATGELSVTIQTDGPISGLALLDVTGATVRVEATGYDVTRPIANGSQSTIALLDIDIPTVTFVTVTIAGASPSDPVGVGTLLLGPLEPLGVAETTPSVGINDYSRKNTDDFGNTTFVERAWAKRMGLRSLIASEAVDMQVRRMASLRATPALWIGNADFDSLMIYGFFRDFSVEIGETVSLCSLTIEGLSTAAPLQPPGQGTVISWTDIVDDDPEHPKPDDGATVGAPEGTPVGDRPVEDVLFDIDSILVDVGTIFDDIGDLNTQWTSVATRTSALEALSANAPNLLMNSDFRDGLNHWNGNTTQFYPDFEPLVGSVARIDPNGNNYTIWQEVPVQAGLTYVLSYEGLIDGGVINNNSRVYVQHMDDAGVALSQVWLTFPTARDERKSVALVAPAGTTKTRISIRKWNPDGLYATRLMFQEGSEATAYNDRSDGYPTFAAIRTEEAARVAETAALATRASALEATVNTGATANETLRSRIATEETARANGDTALANRATALEATVNSETDGNAALKARIADEEAARATAIAAEAASRETITAALRTEAANSLATAVKNPNFSAYSNATGGADDWRSNASGTITRTAGTTSPYAMWIYSEAGVSGYTSQIVGSTSDRRIKQGQWWVLEADVRLESGTFAGAGVLFRVFNTSSGYTDALRISFADDPDSTGAVVGNGTAGNRYSFSKLVQANYANAAYFIIYAMGHWNGFGSIAAQNSVTFHRVNARPATEAEIEARKTSGDVTTLTAEVTTQAGAIVDLTGKTEAYWQVTANAGASTAFIGAKADGESGIVSIGGTEFHIYSPASGGSWKRAVSIVGGDATFSGNLLVGGSIALGTRKIPVALQSFELQVYDGMSVTYGGNLGNIPKVAADFSQFPALPSGQNYVFRADSHTPTGFIARVKKVTDAVPTTVTSAAGTASGTGPSWQAHKPTVDDAYDGKYEFRVTGSMFRLSEYLPELETYVTNGWIRFQTWFRPGGTGSWIAGPKATVNADPGADGQYPYDRTFIVDYGSTIGQGSGTEFGVSIDATYQFGINTLTGLTSVKYAYADDAVEVTATPGNSPLLPVRISPQND